ncbi:hypothetical protein DW355_01740 [Hylemonella gracilis]|uniref:Uncharacterized protein n=1 Tax=Hylemonella gracilis TaxID=80880 RepID=A0A4P6UHW6_9BURK|nr:PhaM family polyhydroxyalkanoate granule multifunctional regulatory protein [Hylemonella gracilis]QBK03660.1 hypothetical protein DW355_01740 [Hylemonella gracilis]
MNQKAHPQGLGADFGAYVPGFDFLQKLAQGDPQALYASWIAPTLDPKVLDQRIGELKAVLFWLDQNTAALKATLQALEVQKMTLAALRSMGSMGSMSGMAGSMPGAQTSSEDRAAASSASAASAAGADPAAPPFMADAMQYWGALTQQFQTIANQALQDVAARGAAASAAAAAPGPQSSAAASADAAPAPRRATPRKATRPGADDPKPNSGPRDGPNA